MFQTKRPRAQYPSENGLMEFKNPSSDGPVNHVSFSSVDTMFHIMLRYNPLRDNDYTDFAYVIQKAVETYNGNSPMVGRELRFAAPKKMDECFVSVWFPGDLEDMIQIVDSIPELQTGGWLRDKVDGLKECAGLGKDDLPFLIRYSDNNFITMDVDLHFYRRTFFDSAWLSAAGGTLEFAEDTPDDSLIWVVKAFSDAGAVTSSPFNDAMLKNAHDGPRLRFHWNAMMQNSWASCEKVQELLTKLEPQLVRNLFLA